MLEAMHFEFMRNALIAGFLASVSCGIIGCYVVVKRLVSLSGGIAHAAFGGVGVGYFLGINPVLGALFFSLLSALCIGLTTRRTRLPEDTIIGIIWALGMALGVVLISLSPGYTPDLFGYLFGSILAVSRADLLSISALDLAVIVLVILFYKELLSISFDEEFSIAVGVPVEHLYLLLLSLIALTAVVLMRVVGLILVIALLSIPAAIARQYTYNLKVMMLLSILLGAIFTILGLWLSYELDLSSGATIILVGGSLFFLLLGISKLRHKKAFA